MKVLNHMSGFPPWGPNKWTGNPQGIWLRGPEGFDYMTSTGLGKREPPGLAGTNKTLNTPRLRGKKQWPPRRLNQNNLLVLGGLLWKCWSAGAHHGMGALAAAVWEGHSLCKPSSRSPLTRPWSWVTSGQNYQRGSATPPKALLSKTLPTRERPSFSHYQPLPSEGLHKPLNLLH